MQKFPSRKQRSCYERAEWGIVIGVVTSALMSLAPWMFMVHAKLAVLVTRIEALSEKVDTAAEANGELWSLSPDTRPAWRPMRCKSRPWPNAWRNSHEDRPPPGTGPFFGQ